MLQASQRRPPRPGGDVLSLTAQPSGATPGILAMHPGCTPRPRNRRVYEAACAAANGEPVVELDAQQITPRMRAWCGGSFLTVVEARHLRVGDIEEFELLSECERGHQFVLLRLEGDGAISGCIVGELDTPVYVLA